MDEVLDAGLVRRVFAQDGLDTPDALSVRDYMEGQNRGFLLVHLVLTQTFVHYGEAQAIRGLLAHPGC